MKEWFTPAEIADLKLAGLPATKRGVNKIAGNKGWNGRTNLAGAPLARRREGRGGGWEYHYTVFPDRAQQDLVARDLAAKRKDGARSPEPKGRGERWAWFERLADARKDKARARLDVLLAIEALERGGLTKNLAVHEIAKREGIGARTAYGWFDLVAGVSREDWLVHLAPRHAGRTKTVECDPRAWDMLVSDYLRASRPTMESCYRRMAAAAAEHGWTVPSERTLKRRVEREIPAAVVVLARHGAEALKRLYPAQERDRSVFHALEAINADGHRWDVWVKWPDGEVSRPCMTAIQDVYSGSFLAWRVDKTENKEAFRLAFGDMVEACGIPEIAYLDNGRNFASKWLTGGIANRYRFKVKEEEPVGILTSLGVEVHWTTPYSGQSKPIERAFRDFCDAIAKHPAFEGAWTGNSPVNKPENYGSKAVPLDRFLSVVEDGIVEHNARKGRRAAVCAGRSFDETFAESYAMAPIRKATAEQRRLWLLAAEGVTAAGQDGAIRLMGNRFWGDFLTEIRGTKIVARFDPEALHDGIHVYRLDGGYLGFAECVEAAGFNDVNAAREHGRARRQWSRAQRDALAAMRKLDPDQVDDLIPAAAEPGAPSARVVKADFERPVAALRPVAKADPLSDSQQEAMARVVENLADRRPRVEATPAERFRRALAAEEALAAGGDVDDDTRRWLPGYQGTDEYRARKRLYEDFGEAVLAI
jgi:putative transposase